MLKILFGAFDAGGGNAIFPVVKNILKNRSFTVLSLVGGPSKEIFKRKKIKYTDADALSTKDIRVLVKNFKPDFFISGTSAGVTFDKKILQTAHGVGAKTIYILDYWAHYWERFSSAKKDFKYLPDTICVMDNKAKKEMISDGFNATMITVTGNPYFDYFQKNIKGAGNKLVILFISQPYIGKKDEFGYDEFDVLNDILESLSDTGSRFRVIIRPHPKEKTEKYHKYEGKRVSIDSTSPIEKLLSQAGLIVGMNSMVLFQAAIAGKKIISYQPNLKTKDFAISNALGLSKLVTTKIDLKKLLQRYLQNDFPKFKKAINVTVPHATKNVINLIKKLDKYEKNK